MKEIKEHMTSSKPVRLDGCLYNMGVECSKAACARCGWNPVVQKERREETRASLQAPVFHWKKDLV